MEPPTQQEPGPPFDPFEQANQIFSEALDLPASERAAFVRARSETENIYADVLEMLARYETMGDFMAEPIIYPRRTNSCTADPAKIAAGDVLSQRFRIVELIGRAAWARSIEPLTH